MAKCKLYIFELNITAPQDAHTRLVLQVYLGSNTLEFTTKPEVEGFRDQGFVLPEVESLRVLFVAS